MALHYAEGDRAPKVVASGAGEIAKRILELAKNNNIPVREDEPLSELLASLPIGKEIPPETYQLVAEILAFLYRTDTQWRKRKEAESSAFRRAAGKSKKTVP